jgi:glycosyltransferase involved in cell wall biosynthesis
VHVLIIHQAFASADEAGGTRHLEFARHLIDQGHRVTVIAGGVNYLTGKTVETSPHLQPGLTIVRPSGYQVLHRTFLHRALSFVSFMCSAAIAALRVRNVDVVVGTSPPILQGATAWVVARLRGVPFVFEVRDLWPDFAVELKVLRNPVLIAACRRLERFLYRRADRLLVNSPGFIPHVRSVSGRTPALIPNGADGLQFSPAQNGEHVRARWNAADRFIVLYAGAHGMANGLETVLEAASLLRERRPILFVLVGDGKEKAALASRADAAGLENVRFEPAQPKHVMPEIVAAADVCLATLKDIPLFRTTYPNKVFDYMAAGKPTIVAIDGVIRQVVEEAGGGVFVAPGNAVALAEAVSRLESDRRGCARMGLNARAFVLQRFNRRDQAASFCALLTECTVETAV